MNFIKNWSKTNSFASLEHFSEENFFYPLNETTQIWEHNYKKPQVQSQYDEIYYVPRIYLLKEFKSQKISTQTFWASHIPNIFPKADYILLAREKKKLLKETIERGLISYETFIETFGKYLDDFEIPGYKIIHPDNAAKAAKLFQSIKFENSFEEFAERLPWDKVLNVQP